MHEIFIKPNEARMIITIKSEHANEPDGIHKPNKQLQI
jgi:hypothetical protein